MMNATKFCEFVTTVWSTLIAMFKFSFQVNAEDNNNFSQVSVQTPKKDETTTTIEWYNSNEVVPQSEVLENLDLYDLNSTEMVIGDMTLNHTMPGFVLRDIRKNSDGTMDIAVAERNHSDLIPGIYEGGAKLWECTEDLLKYLSENGLKSSFGQKCTLDLGCGAGLLGIFALKCGGRVHFQDYNKEVLDNITIPNVLLNTPLPPKKTDFDIKELNKSVKFFCGDWEKFARLTSDQYDIIVTSETIYNPENHQKLLDTFDMKLKPDGFVLLAAKVHYFGVGGGLRQFEQLVHTDKRFESEAVWSSEVGVKREIICLRRYKSNS